MPINSEELRKSFEALSTRYGGSLLHEKKLLNQDEVVVFIGLGGLGGRAVNAIKAATTEKLNNPDRRFFICVDTCAEDMGLISAVTKDDVKGSDDDDFRVRGCIDEQEKFPLYKDTYKVKTLGHDIDSWMDREVFAETEVNDKGAQGVRQIGRLMLMANGNYEDVCERLSGILNEAKSIAELRNVEMKIYIVAGISGGTGSGTVVDFTYMVRKVISEFPLRQRKVDAILFTPDVQFNDKGIDEKKRKGLKANFYAAIKEVDFFFNNKARGSAYECPYGPPCEAYKEDIFDFCTLVSRRAQGVSIANNSNGVVKKLADALAFELSGIKGDTATEVAQPFSSYFSNVYDNFSLWWPDNTEGKGLDMPDWAPSRYSAIAYSSFYIPRDELVAYCAELLMEELAKHWKKMAISPEEIKAVLNRHHLGSNRSFASTIFDILGCDGFFEVQKAMLPVDGFGPGKVKNCGMYLDLMRETAETEGSTQRAKLLLNQAKLKQDAVFVNPIISLVDQAFADGDKGPVYAIRLLSADAARKYGDCYGFIATIRELIGRLAEDVRVWDFELSQLYNELRKKADAYDGQLSIDASVLNTFTNDCRQYGEDLLKCNLLKESAEYLIEILNKLIDKNDRVFQIYTYAFEYLVETLKKDSAYVGDTNRHREGQTTVFSFDLTDFQENEKNSKRFKDFFKTLVDTKTISKEAKEFVSIIFGQLKQLLDPAEGGTENSEVRPEMVIEIIREFFKSSFAGYTEEVIEKFCVVAYSDIDVTPEKLTEVWDDPKKRALALNRAADAITAKVVSQRNIMLSCADVTKDLKNFSSYDVFAALPKTKGINDYLNHTFLLEADWSEFIGYTRIFGFPISFLADLDDCKKEYDLRSHVPGIHLDEVHGKDDVFGDWRYSLPEPYNYMVAKYLGNYQEGGSDIAEVDKNRMYEILELARKAKALGLLISDIIVDKPNENKGNNPEVGQAYYKIIWRLLTNIKDFDGQKRTITSNIRKAISTFKNEGREISFFPILEKSGYKPADPISIQWVFTHNRLRVMKNRTNMGDEIEIGNFIVLLRSNPYWEASLRSGIELFGKLHEIYDSVCAEFDAADVYKARINDFTRAIRVGRIVPFNDATGAFAGFKIKVTDKPEDDIAFTNNGLELLDNMNLVYLCFTESYMKLDSDKYEAMNILVAHDFDNRVDRSQASIDNMRWFLDNANEVITNPEYLNHYDVKAKNKIFAELIVYSKYQYSLPKTSNGGKDIAVVIENINDFYKGIRKNFEDNIKLLGEQGTSGQSGTSNGTDGNGGNVVPGNSWTCASCGAQGNRGNFCANCGKPPITTWTCTSCGAQGNTGKFCSNCGNPPITTWTCTSCGAQGNDGNFCAKCGKPKDAPAVTTAPTVWYCTKCGKENGPDVNFCPGCGTPKN